MKCALRFFFCSFLILFLVSLSDSFILHEPETEPFGESLTNNNQASPPGLTNEARSRYDAPPDFFRDLYIFLQSELSVGEKAVDFLAKPCQNISSVENETYLSFPVNDEKFTSRQQFHIVFIEKRPVRTNQHRHGIAHSEDGEHTIEPADGKISNAVASKETSRNQAIFTIGKYKAFNATGMISYVKMGRESHVIIKTSMRLGNQSVNVNNFVETRPASTKGPLLVAFDNIYLKFYTGFFSQTRENPTEGSHPLPNSHDDGLPTSDKRHKRETSGDCRLHDWFVDFNDLHWLELIYAPRGYNAKSCHGSCRVDSLLRMSNTTQPVKNHVLIRSLFRHEIRQSNHDDLADLPPRSCCVPIEFEPLNMLYLTSGEEGSYFVLRSVPNMIAKKCGCA